MLQRTNCICYYCCKGSKECNAIPSYWTRQAQHNNGSNPIRLKREKTKDKGRKKIKKREEEKKTRTKNKGNNYPEKGYERQGKTVQYLVCNQLLIRLSYCRSKMGHMSTSNIVSTLFLDMPAGESRRPSNGVGLMGLHGNGFTSRDSSRGA